MKNCLIITAELIKYGSLKEKLQKKNPNLRIFNLNYRSKMLYSLLVGNTDFHQL